MRDICEWTNTTNTANHTYVYNYLNNFYNCIYIIYDLELNSL